MLKIDHLSDFLHRPQRAKLSMHVGRVMRRRVLGS